MKKIKIDANSNGAKFIKELMTSKKVWREKIEKETFIPDDIKKFMNEKTEETDKLNNGTLDKSTFRLGMMCMYYHILKNKNV